MQFSVILLIAIAIVSLPLTSAHTTGCINSNTPSSACCSGDIEIDDSVVTIGEYAFRYCSSLTSIVIPDSVVSIERYAFLYCSSLPTPFIWNNNIN
jgi:hypothetical protein